MADLMTATVRLCLTSVGMRERGEEERVVREEEEEEEEQVGEEGRRRTRGVRETVRVWRCPQVAPVQRASLRRGR